MAPGPICKLCMLPIIMRVFEFEKIFWGWCGKAKLKNACSQWTNITFSKIVTFYEMHVLLKILHVVG